MDRMTTLPAQGGDHGAQPWPLCSTCALPRPGRFTRGRCGPCYQYWRRYGAERPPHLWGRDFTGRLAARLAGQ